MNPPASSRKLRVLVVDDSILNRRAVRLALEESGSIEVVGEASDGDEALRLVTERRPDAITLDLEMPRMDGFTFLRILMAKHPTPVIVVSSHSQKENVFRALELGAVDFVEKPEAGLMASQAARVQVLEKILLARSLRPLRPIVPAPSGAGFVAEPSTARGLGTPPLPRLTPRFVIAIAASTGGPAALIDIFSRLPARLPAAVVVVQHMPARFTRAFAERLNRRGSLHVTEATDREPLVARCGYVCPGGQCIEVETSARGEMRLRIVPPSSSDTYVPSADRLFASVAKASGSRAIGVVLTGMGTDGVEGSRAIADARGLVIVESKETAVVNGMPAAVQRAGVVSRVLPLPAIGELLATLVS